MGTQVVVEDEPKTHVFVISATVEDGVAADCNVVWP
jgi:hypothetical protein